MVFWLWSNCVQLGVSLFVFVLKCQYFKNSKVLFLPVNHVNIGGCCLWMRSTSPYPCWRCSFLLMPKIGGQDIATGRHLWLTGLYYSHGCGVSARCASLGTTTCVPLNGEKRFSRGFFVKHGKSCIIIKRFYIATLKKKYKYINLYCEYIFMGHW